MTEAVLLAQIDACRAQVRALRPYSPEWERAIDSWEAALVELDAYQTHDSRLVANGPQTAA